MGGVKWKKLFGSGCQFWHLRFRYCQVVSGGDQVMAEKNVVVIMKGEGESIMKIVAMNIMNITNLRIDMIN